MSFWLLDISLRALMLIAHDNRLYNSVQIRDVESCLNKNENDIKN